jgi:hypothetical protein
MAEIENEMLHLGVYALVVRGQGQDLLMGKQSAHDFIKVNGLEKLLRLLILDLDVSFSFIYNDDISGFLNAIQEKMKINLLDLKENLELNIQGMRDVESDDIMIWHLVITKTLENLRQQIFDAGGWGLIKKIYKSINGKPMSKKIQTAIEKQDSKGNEDMSLLYNLVFIEYLSRIYKKTKLNKICLDLAREKITHLLANI